MISEEGASEPKVSTTRSSVPSPPTPPVAVSFLSPSQEEQVCPRSSVTGLIIIT